MILSRTEAEAKNNAAGAETLRYAQSDSFVTIIVISYW